MHGCFIINLEKPSERRHGLLWPSRSVHLEYHHKPEKFLQEIGTNYLYQKIFLIVRPSQFWNGRISSSIILIWLKGEYTSVYSIQVSYNEKSLFHFNWKLISQPINRSERAIIRILIQFSSIGCIYVSDKNFAFIWIQFLGIGMVSVCQSIRSYLYHLSCERWAQKTQLFWTVALQQKALTFFALALSNTEAIALIYSISHGIGVHFSARVKLNCLKLNSFNFSTLNIEVN